MNQIFLYSLNSQMKIKMKIYFLEHSQYYDPTSMIVTGEINNHINQNEMTSEISTIAPDLTLTAEPEKTISTESKFGFFHQQMAELEPKVY